TITGSLGVGAALAADPGTWTGNPAPTYAYQWQRCDSDGTNCVDIPGADSDSYTQTRDDVGKTIRVEVTGTNSEGSADASSDSTEPVPGPPLNAAEPTISGTPEVGQTLTADPGEWSAFPEPEFGYQWLRCDSEGNDCQPISGATSENYDLTVDDAGRTIRVEVTATNSEGSDSATSGQTAVTEGAPVNIGSPSITGTPQVGETLTADPGEWSAYPAPEFSYRWLRCDDEGSNCEEIDGATDSTYTLTTADQGSRIRVEVTATNDLGPGSSDSAPTESIAPPTPSGKPDLKVWVNTPKRVGAGQSFKIAVKVKNRATSTRSVSTRAGTTAEGLRTCASLPRGLFVVSPRGGTVSGRTICWTRDSLAAGRSVTYIAV
ncbi:MAG: hypothetical protein ACO3ZZ_08930, partial [Solirubrobacterales bacterium]